MAIRPGTLCKLVKNKLIDAQQGFVDTFNWLVASMANLKGGTNCTVSWPAPDTPQVDANAQGGGGGGGGGGNVDDVTAETYQGGESIKVEYANGGSAGHIPLSFVKDVQQTTYQGGPALEVTFSDGSSATYIPLSSAVKFAGTSGTTSKTDAFTISSASNARVTATCNGSGITLGVYYV